MSTDETEPEYGLVLPFVVCRSQGGPYEDEAFVAGFEAGNVNADPALLDQGRYVHAGNVPLVDLIAMHHGRTLTIGDAEDEWTWVQTAKPGSPS